MGFNPRSRTGSDMPIAPLIRWVHRFNPRSRTGSDEGLGRDAAGEYLFQSTLPHGERLGGECFSCTSKCFNPRSRTGSDCTTAKRRLYCLWRHCFANRSLQGLPRFFATLINLLFLKCILPNMLSGATFVRCRFAQIF